MLPIDGVGGWPALAEGGACWTCLTKPRAAQPRVRAADAAVHTVLSVAATTRPVKVGAKPVGDSATVPAGLQVFQVLDDAYSRSALNALVPLKPGRPGPAG